MTGYRDDQEAFELRLRGWLRDERGIEGPRRLVRIWDDRILVTKVPEGFSAGLVSAAYSLPALVDLAALRKMYEAMASRAPAGGAVKTWRSAIEAMVEQTLGLQLADLREDIVIGIESVGAMLDSIFWTDPPNDSAHAPSNGETEAYRDALARLNGDQALFTRSYGVFEGREVVNYCPAAPLARTILANGWSVITGLPPPE